MSQQNNRLNDLLARNTKYHQKYTAPPPLAAIMATLPPSPMGITIVSCCDPRVIPEDFMGFSMGESVVIRNAGGRAANALPSILLLDSLIPMQAVAIVHHTDCGVTHVTEASMHAHLVKLAPGHAEAISKIDFGTYEAAALEASVIEDMHLVRESPYIRHEMPVRGFVLDIQTGVLREVEAAKVAV